MQAPTYEDLTDKFNRSAEATEIAALRLRNYGMFVLVSTLVVSAVQAFRFINLLGLPVIS